MLSKTYPWPSMVIGLGEMEKGRLSHICVAFRGPYTGHEEGIALCFVSWVGPFICSIDLRLVICKRLDWPLLFSFSTLIFNGSISHSFFYFN